VACDSRSTSNATVSTISGTATPRNALNQQQQPELQQQQQKDQQQQHDSSSSVQQEQQEIKGLKQLVLQQQELLTALQRDMQELRGALIQQQQQSSSRSSSSSSLSMDAQPGLSQQQIRQAEQQHGPSVVPILASPSPRFMQQQQQQQQQLLPSLPPSQPEHHPAVYQPMSVETFQSLPDKLILVRHAESLGNVDATTYSDTPDYEVRGCCCCWGRVGPGALGELNTDTMCGAGRA
jgi:hypothetical protein